MKSLKFKIISGIALLVCFNVSVNAQNLSWTQALQTVSEESVGFMNNSITEDNEGNILISGTYNAELSFGGFTLQPVDGVFIRMFLTKISGSGEVLWLKTFDVPQLGINTFQKPVFDNNGNFYLVFNPYLGSGDFDWDLGNGVVVPVGSTLNQAVIVCFNPEGVAQYFKAIQTEDSEILVNLKVNSINDSLFVSGTFSGNLTIGDIEVQSNNGSMDIFVAKTDLELNPSWLVSINGTRDYQSHEATIDDLGNIIIALSFEGDSLFSGNYFVYNPDFDFTPFVGNSDIAVIKLNPQGETQWMTRIASSELDNPNKLFATADNGILMSSNSSGTLNVAGVTIEPELNAIIKLNSAGSPEYAFSLEGYGINSAARDEDGFIYLGYQFTVPSFTLGNINVVNTGMDNGTSDLAIIKMDESGEIYWIERIGSIDNESVNSVKVLNSGKMVVAGTFSGTEFMLGNLMLENDFAPVNNGFVAYADLPAGLNNIVESASVLIYPNPTSDYLMLNTDLSGNSELAYSIYNSTGQLIKNNVELKTLPASISIHELSTGNYFISVRSDTYQKTVPFTVLR
ncbi:MAG: T9SS type A sorting domain-containing protein [Bacteroidia bacterium]